MATKLSLPLLAVLAAHTGVYGGISRLHRVKIRQWGIIPRFHALRLREGGRRARPTRQGVYVKKQAPNSLPPIGELTIEMIEELPYRVLQYYAKEIRVKGNQKVGKTLHGI
eukprot:1355746-Amorphochlora_amoeboformis.AAC.1